MNKFNINDLVMFERIVKLEQMALKEWLKGELIKMGYDVLCRDGYLFAKGEVPVLLVAHMDTVHREPVRDFCISSTGVIMSPQGIGGDDRCGVYMCLKMLEKHKCSIMFCEDEEVGRIGARKYANDIKSTKKRIDGHNGFVKELKYIIEFDRRGDRDCVFYECENDEFIKFVESTGFYKKTWGSFSDIGTIAPALKVAAVNLSSGFYDEHTTHEYVDWLAMHRSLEEAEKLILKHSEVEKFVYITRQYHRHTRHHGGLTHHYGYQEYCNNYYDDNLYSDKYGFDKKREVGKPTKGKRSNTIDKDINEWHKECEVCFDVVHYDNLEYVIGAGEHRYTAMCISCYKNYCNRGNNCIECGEMLNNTYGYGVCCHCMDTYGLTEYLPTAVSLNVGETVTPQAIDLDKEERCDNCHAIMDDAAYICSDDTLVCSIECFDVWEHFLERHAAGVNITNGAKRRLND